MADDEKSLDQGVIPEVAKLLGFDKVPDDDQPDGSTDFQCIASIRENLVNLDRDEDNDENTDATDYKKSDHEEAINEESKRVVDEEIAEKLKFLQSKNGNSNDSTDNKSDNDTNMDTVIAKIKEEFVTLLIDCLSINHSKYSNKINDTFMATLGNPINISKKGVGLLSSTFPKNLPSKDIMFSDTYVSNPMEVTSDNENSNDDDDEDDDDDEEDEDENDDEDESNGDKDSNVDGSIIEKIRSKKMKSSDINGFLVQDKYIRTIIDAIKCRIDILPLIQFDLGFKGQFQLTIGDLIALLLEISHPSVQKIITSALIEQRLAVPILYCMNEILVKNDDIDNCDDFVLVDGYLRDNLHLSSQSKVRSDGMSQTSTSRNKPLILFVGSEQVSGKTTMLTKLYPNQQFNTCDGKRTPLHDTSIDLIYLSDLQKVNYHILDVHGKINDPYYDYCTKNLANRTDCLFSLASLCHCVLLEITQKQLRNSKKVKNFLQKNKQPKEKFTVESLCIKNLKIAIIIRDCNEVTINAFNKGMATKEDYFAADIDVFACPSNKTNNFWKDFVDLTKHWLDNETKEIDYSDVSKVSGHNITKWWTKIEKFGLFLPLKIVKLYFNDVNEYRQKRYEIEYFYKQLNGEFNKLFDGELVKRKLELFPYGELFSEYKKLLHNVDSLSEDNDYIEQMALNIVSNIATTPKISKLLEIFIFYCLPTRKEYNKSNLTSWMLSEYLYILDDMCNNRNAIVLRDIRENISKLKSQKSKALNNDKLKIELQEKLEKEYDKLKNTEITGGDFLHNVQSLVHFIMEWRKRFANRRDNTPTTTNNAIRILIDCVQEFSHRLFIQGTPVEFCDGGYTRMDSHFMNYVFGSGDHESIDDEDELRVVSIAVAGPQSTGKSTLLRRLFGIEARASAGRTTNGLNCCKIRFVNDNGYSIDNKNDDEKEMELKQKKDSQLIIVDTEGIKSIEKAEKDAKRDRKIILGALASSRVFILNIMKDATDAQIMDVILWAYNKLNLSESSNTDSVKELRDIKFIFVIRDVTEVGNSDWLERQINDINNVLTQSLQSIQNVQNKGKRSDKDSSSEAKRNRRIISSINDVIGEPIFFPMPSAFNTSTNAPNEHFSERCVELRSLIMKEVFNVNVNNSYKNNKDWCLQMINIWDRVVQYEDVLTPADFREQSQRQEMQNAIEESTKTFRQEMQNIVQDAANKCFNQENEFKTDDDSDSNVKDPRIRKFAAIISEKYEIMIEEYIAKLEEDPSLKQIGKTIQEEYLTSFRNRMNNYLSEDIDTFEDNLQYEKQQKYKDEIQLELDKTIEKLKQQSVTDPNKIEKEYDSLFERIILEIKQEFQTEDKKKKMEKDITTKFQKAYTKAILDPNQVHGQLPCALKQLQCGYIKRDTYDDNNNDNDSTKAKREAYIKLFANSNQFVQIFSEWAGNQLGWIEKQENEIYEEFVELCNKWLARYIIKENRDDSYEWMKPFHELEIWLNGLFNNNRILVCDITTEFRTATHFELRNEVLNKLISYSTTKSDELIVQVKELQSNEWASFKLRVNTNNKEIAATIVKQTIEENINVWLKYKLKKISELYFKRNEKFNNPNTENILRDEFNRAFDTGKWHNGSIDKAIKFISLSGQCDAMEKQFEVAYEKYRNDLFEKQIGDWDYELKSKLSPNNINFNINNTHKKDKLFDYLKADASQLLNLITQNIKEMNDNLKINNTQDFQKELVKIIKEKEDNQGSGLNAFLINWLKPIFSQKNSIKYSTIILRWNFRKNCNIAQFREFKQVLIERLNNINQDGTLTKNIDTMLHDKDFIKFEKQLKNKIKIKYVGCRQCCPCCGAKCSQRKDHDIENKNSKHETKFHLLMAFSGVHERKSKKLIVDICTTQHNIYSRWGNNKTPWNDYVKEHYPSWHPIPSTDFDRKSASLMFKMFFDKKLQDKLIKEKYTACKPANKDDCVFSDQLTWFGSLSRLWKWR